MAMAENSKYKDDIIVHFSHFCRQWFPEIPDQRLEKNVRRFIKVLQKESEEFLYDCTTPKDNTALRNHKLVGKEIGESVFMMGRRYIPKIPNSLALSHPSGQFNPPGPPGTVLSESLTSTSLGHSVYCDDGQQPSVEMKKKPSLNVTFKPCHTTEQCSAVAKSPSQPGSNLSIPVVGIQSSVASTSQVFWTQTCWRQSDKTMKHENFPLPLNAPSIPRGEAVSNSFVRPDYQVEHQTCEYFKKQQDCEAAMKNWKKKRGKSRKHFERFSEPIDYEGCEDSTSFGSQSPPLNNIESRLWGSREEYLDFLRGMKTSKGKQVRSDTIIPRSIGVQTSKPDVHHGGKLHPCTCGLRCNASCTLQSFLYLLKEKGYNVCTTKLIQKLDHVCRQPHTPPVTPCTNRINDLLDAGVLKRLHHRSNLYLDGEEVLRKFYEVLDSLVVKSNVNDIDPFFALLRIGYKETGVGHCIALAKNGQVLVLYDVQRSRGWPRKDDNIGNVSEVDLLEIVDATVKEWLPEIDQGRCCEELMDVNVAASSCAGAV